MTMKDTFFPKVRTKRFVDVIQVLLTYPTRSVLDGVLDDVEVAHDDDVRAGFQLTGSKGLRPRSDVKMKKIFAAVQFSRRGRSSLQSADCRSKSRWLCHKAVEKSLLRTISQYLRTNKGKIAENGRKIRT